MPFIFFILLIGRRETRRILHVAFVGAAILICAFLFLLALTPLLNPESYCTWDPARHTRAENERAYASWSAAPLPNCK